MPDSHANAINSAAETLRLFIAVEIDAAARAQVAKLAEKLKKGTQFTGAHPSWVAPANWHFTLMFLGKTPCEKLEPLQSALRAIEVRAFEIELGGLGAFPNPKRPSVLWIGLRRGAEPLIALQRAVLQALEPLDYHPDVKPFHPHLTLARIKSTKGVEGLMKVVENHQRINCGTCMVANITLFRSELKPSGAVYTPLLQHPPSIA